MTARSSVDFPAPLVPSRHRLALVDVELESNSTCTEPYE